MVGRRVQRKPTGMLCIEGDLYLAVQDLALDFDDAPAATIARSRDKGRTWDWDAAGPMFHGHELTTLFFLDFGRDGEHAIDDYVYVYALEGNWRRSYAARVLTRLGSRSRADPEGRGARSETLAVVRRT